MNKLKKTLSNRPLSLPVALVTLVLYVLGMALPSTSLLIAGMFCMLGAFNLAMWFDL